MDPEAMKVGMTKPMNVTWEVIYQYESHVTTAVIRPVKPKKSLRKTLGLGLLALSLGGITGPLIPAIRLESGYWASRVQAPLTAKAAVTELPASAPVVVNPLVKPDGSTIIPVNRDFSLVIPAIGVNAPIIANVDPSKPGQYDAALLQGVAHSSTSMLPDQDGTVYLFSHSTNYDWFVKDLNAVFYLLKNLNEGDSVVLMYRGKQYDYVIRQKKIVNPKDISYLVPTIGKKSLILQTCWPPGSTTERLLLFADLVDEK